MGENPMKLVVGGRGSGKTRALIEEAARYNIDAWDRARAEAWNRWVEGVDGMEPVDLADWSDE
ncbi:MAG: hypothetical protein GY871_04700 [Actinomycetales bacterium]|nr:hypothetical protein [Actinomycetales bacterium]